MMIRILLIVVSLCSAVSAQINMNLTIDTNVITWSNVDTRFGYYVQHTESLDEPWTNVYSDIHSTDSSLSVNIDPTNNASFFRIVAPVWNTDSTIPKDEKWVTQFSTRSNEIYVLYEGDGSFLRYSPASNSWDTLAFKTNTALLPFTGWCDDKYYVMNGYQLSSTSVYDPVGNIWSSATPCPLSNYLQGVVLNSSIYIVGGQPEGQTTYYDEVYRYDPSTDQWNALANMPEARSLSAAIVYDEEHIYVIGGAPSSWAQPTNTLFDYVIAENTWYIRQNMPTPRRNPSAILHDGKIYVAGGAASRGDETTSYIYPAPLETYDIQSGTWLSETYPTYGTPIQKVINSHLYIFQPARSAWRKSLDDSSWNEVLTTSVYGFIDQINERLYNAYEFGGVTEVESIKF